MKQLILTLVVFLCTITCSCVQNEDSFISENTTEISDLDGFNTLLVNLNDNYILETSMASRGNNNDGGNKNEEDKKEDDPGIDIVTPVDFLGGCAGQWLGGQILAVAGEYIGGPIGGGIGAFIGFCYRAAIGELCAEAASELAASATQDCNGYATPSYSPSYKSNTSILISSYSNMPTSLDSIGYRHNQFMIAMKNSPFKFKRAEYWNDIDFNYRLNLAFINSNVPHFEDEELNKYVEKEIRFLLSDILSDFFKYLDNKMTYDEFLKSVEEKLISRYNPTGESIKLMSMGMDIMKTCGKLPLSEIDGYATDLNKLIHDNTKLNSEDKATMAFYAQIAVNSSLCWRK